MMLSHSYKLTRIRLLPIVLFATATFWGCSAATEDGQGWAEAPLEEEGEDDTAQEGMGDNTLDESLATLRQPLKGTHKLCSVFLTGNWRDSIIVPDGWTVDDCRAFALAQSMPANSFNLACVGDDGFFGFGSAGGGLPSLNPCGW